MPRASIPDPSVVRRATVEGGSCRSLTSEPAAMVVPFHAPERVVGSPPFARPRRGPYLGFPPTVRVGKQPKVLERFAQAKGRGRPDERSLALSTMSDLPTGSHSRRPSMIKIGLPTRAVNGNAVTQGAAQLGHNTSWHPRRECPRRAMEYPSSALDGSLRAWTKAGGWLGRQPSG